MTAETKARRTADRAYEKRMNALTSIAHGCEVLHPTGQSEQVRVVIDGVQMQGPVEGFNRLVELMGFRPVRITHNMLNPESKRFAIDINTPCYCDPGCESYHVNIMAGFCSAITLFNGSPYCGHLILFPVLPASNALAGCRDAFPNSALRTFF